MDLAQLKQKLLAEHHQAPQVAQVILHSFALLEDALRQLAQLGHPFHLQAGQPPAGEVWPKMLFHQQIAPNGREVLCLADAKDLGPGWHYTALAAQLDEGMAHQFLGRGGVRRKGMMVSLEAPRSHADHLAEQRRIRADMIEKWKGKVA